MRDVMTIPEPVLCECGCGEATNERTIEAYTLRAQGLRSVEIAERWGLTPAAVKAALTRRPARYRPGHVSRARMTPAFVEVDCGRCGHTMRVGLNREMPRFCQRWSCRADALGGFHDSIRRHVQAKRDERAAVLDQFFQERRTRIERIMRRRRWRTPEAREQARRAARRYMAELETLAAEWLAEQPEDVQLLVASADFTNYRDRHLSDPVGDTRTLGDFLTYGDTSRGGREWADPTADVALDTVTAQEAIDDLWLVIQAEGLAG